MTFCTFLVHDHCSLVINVKQIIVLIVISRKRILEIEMKLLLLAAVFIFGATQIKLEVEASKDWDEYNKKMEEYKRNMQNGKREMKDDMEKGGKCPREKCGVSSLSSKAACLRKDCIKRECGITKNCAKSIVISKSDAGSGQVLTNLGMDWELRSGPISSKVNKEVAGLAGRKISIFIPATGCQRDKCGVINGADVQEMCSKKECLERECGSLVICNNRGLSSGSVSEPQSEARCVEKQCGIWNLADSKQVCSNKDCLVNSCGFKAENIVCTDTNSNGDSVFVDMGAREKPDSESKSSSGKVSANSTILVFVLFLPALVSILKFHL